MTQALLEVRHSIHHRRRDQTQFDRLVWASQFQTHESCPPSPHVAARQRQLIFLGKQRISRYANLCQFCAGELLIWTF
jgi:hypothetical protein